MLGRTLQVSAVVALLTFLGVAQTIPPGTQITVRSSHALSSDTAKVGDRFDASLTHTLVVRGKTLAKAGAPAHGKVTLAKSSGRLHAPGQLTVRLTSLQVQGKMVPLSTGSFHVQGKSHTKSNASNATKIGGGAAVGAVVGGLAGGGKGAAVGAGAGGAAGTGVAAVTGKEEATIPAEKAMSFTTITAARLR